MSVLIKGMKMPKSCKSCPFQFGNCIIPFNPFSEERHPDCPLSEVPQHGRLIDADALKASLAFAEKTAEWAVPALRAVLMVIDEMPTIVKKDDEKGNKNV